MLAFLHNLSAEEGLDVSGGWQLLLARADVIFVVAVIGGFQAGSRLMADCMQSSSLAAWVRLFGSAIRIKAWMASKSGLFMRGILGSKAVRP
jgi:hypothetical protein